MKGAFGRSGRSNRKGHVNRNPLRKIVDWDGEFETLECGHKQRQKSDFVGPTNAERRRCRQCGKLAREKE